jgi:hypothetical protein
MSTAAFEAFWKVIAKCVKLPAAITEGAAIVIPACLPGPIVAIVKSPFKRVNNVHG